MKSLESLRFEQEADRSGGSAGAFRRADDVAASAPGRIAWACAAGCSFCCHLRVSVTAAETVWIAQHVPDELWPRIEANARRAAGLSAEAYRDAHIRCAMLDDEDRCSIYEHRPLKCRAHTSRSVKACEEALDIPHDNWLVCAVEALRLGLGGGAEDPEFHEALRAARRDVG